MVAITVLALHCFKQGEDCDHVEALTPREGSKSFGLTQCLVFVVWRLLLVVGPYLREHGFCSIVTFSSTNVSAFFFHVLDIHLIITYTLKTREYVYILKLSIYRY